LVWTRTTDNPSWGWGVALGLLAFVLADLALLALLPRLGLSFGAVQPPFLALTLLRVFITLVASALVAQSPLAALVVLGLVHLLLWVSLAYGTTIEPFRLHVTDVQISSPKLSSPGCSLRIVQLSDLHVERLTRRDRALPSLVARLAPDLIVLTGDFLSTSYNDDPHSIEDLRVLLAQLHAPAGIYAIWGTAEVDLPELLRPVLQELGIVVLEDEAVAVSRSEALADECSLWLVGLSCSRDLAADGARLKKLLTDVPPDAFRLLLYHTPDLMPHAATVGIDLYLAGHTHGGQWRVPGFGAILTSSRHWKRYEAGSYREGNTDLYVSRGLGMEGFGAPRARFFCPPEVVLVALIGRGEEA
jgi:predicted MPP superfamily phosphohydrolase